MGQPFSPSFRARPRAPFPAWLAAALLAVALSVLAGPDALAGGGGTEFATLQTQLETWIKGGLGKTIALAAVVIGAVLSVARSNPLPILSGIAFAIFEQYTPDIIGGILTGLI